MDMIELERWKPSEADPRKLEYAGQPTAQEVFEELKYRLESQGYLPDEYFLLDSHWEDGREIPRDADIFCTVDYGASEGVYLDIYLKVNTDNYGALHAYIENDAVNAAKLLLDGGMDFNQCQQWAQERHFVGHEDTMQALADHWSEIQTEQIPAQEIGGQTFG